MLFSGKLFPFFQIIVEHISSRKPLFFSGLHPFLIDFFGLGHEFVSFGLRKINPLEVLFKDRHPLGIRLFILGGPSLRDLLISLHMVFFELFRQCLPGILIRDIGAVHGT